ncbi:MAG: HU family DNA-binding protein [Mycobacteriales bacterium]
MNKSELIEAVAEKLGEGRGLATRAVDTVFDEITKAVAKGEKVALTGFGVFEKRDRAARTARNPATGATVKVKKTSVPAFRAGQGFKDVVSGAKKVAAAGAGVARGAARGAVQGGRSAAKTASKTAAKKAPAKRSR